jgi:hypothetical protein
VSDKSDAFLKSRAICIHCHQIHRNCVAKPDEYRSHDDYWRRMNVTARRPWVTGDEFMKIIVNAEAKFPAIKGRQ